MKECNYCSNRNCSLFKAVVKNGQIVFRTNHAVPREGMSNPCGSYIPIERGKQSLFQAAILNSPDACFKLLEQARLRVDTINRYPFFKLRVAA